MWVEYRRTSTQSHLLFDADRWTAIAPHPMLIRDLSLQGGDCVDFLLSCIQQRKNRWSRAAEGGENQTKMYFYWYLFLKNHYSNALPERGAKSSNPGIPKFSSQKWWTQVWVHHFWDRNVYSQRKSKNMKNDGPNSGYIIFRVFFRYITNIPRV